MPTIIKKFVAVKKTVDRSSLPVNPPKEPRQPKQTRQDKERYILLNEFPYYSIDLHAVLQRSCSANDLASDFEFDLLDDEDENKPIQNNLSTEKVSAYLKYRFNNPITISESLAQILGVESGMERKILTSKEAKKIEDYLIDSYSRLIELRKLSPRDLQSEYACVHKYAINHFKDEWLKAAQENDDLSFLNEADLSDDQMPVWLAYEHWTREEATALSLGKDPSKVCIASLHDLNLPSLFLDEFTQRLELLRRSYPNSEHLTPKEFVAWCRERSLEMKGEFEKASPKFILEDEYRNLRDENERLKELLKSFEKDEGSVSSRHLITLILVMAVDGYGYKLGLANSEASSKLETAFGKCGLSLGQSAIQKKFEKLLSDKRVEPDIRKISNHLFSELPGSKRKKAKPS